MIGFHNFSYIFNSPLYFTGDVQLETLLKSYHPISSDTAAHTPEKREVFFHRVWSCGVSNGRARLVLAETDLTGNFVCTTTGTFVGF